MIERRQGTGTRVVADRPRGPYQPAIHSIDDLRQYAAETVLRLDSVGMAMMSDEEAGFLGTPSNEPWLQVDGVRSAGAVALCSNRVFIQPRFVPFLADLAPGLTLAASINEMASLRSGVEIAGVEQDIVARPMPKRVARHLGLRVGTIAMLFVRRYRDMADEVMLWSLNWHPADQFVYRMRLQRGVPGD